MKKAFSYIRDKYNEGYIVVCVDCDGQHSFRDAMKLCDYVEDHPSTLVLGMRKRSENTPLRSRIGNSITMGVYKYVTGVSVYDTQTGLRAFSDEIMRFILSIDGDRYEYEMNMLLMAVRNGINIHEIEIQTIYIDNNSGSHFNTFRDSYLVYKEIFKFSLSSIISFVIDYLLFTLFMFVFNNINLSNISARIISASVNYNVNKRIVFKSKQKLYKSLSGYILLAISILLINTLLLNIFVNVLSVNAFISKVIVELLLFIFSYIVQRKVVFKN